MEDFDDNINFFPTVSLSWQEIQYMKYKISSRGKKETISQRRNSDTNSNDNFYLSRVIIDKWEELEAISIFDYNLNYENDSTIYRIGDLGKWTKDGEKCLVGYYICSNNQYETFGDIGVNNDYLYRKELTNEQFIENPFNIDNNSKYNKFLRTGDLGKRTKDGEIIYYSRIYFQEVIKEIEEIELLVIENNLKEKLPNIRVLSAPSEKILIVTEYILSEAETENSLNLINKVKLDILSYCTLE
ncbi:hypothetical protein U3516DRAFT_747978 [Neocallimastix sp. 'constans']